MSLVNWFQPHSSDSPAEAAVSFASFSMSGVFTMPGAYVLTVIPYCARSRAAVCVSPRTANFVAV